MALNAGDLDRRVVIQTNTPTPDSSYGGPTDAASTLATRWARRRRLSAREKAVAGMEVGTEAVEYVFRWDATLAAALDTADRISDGADYDIKGVQEGDDYHVELIVTAERRR